MGALPQRPILTLAVQPPRGRLLPITGGFIGLLKAVGHHHLCQYILANLDCSMGYLLADETMSSSYFLTMIYRECFVGDPSIF